MSRSLKGCWTCRLRRKKCDEKVPQCVACESRGLTCHGYGKERPRWMDGGVRERDELGRIKQGVKENRRRQRGETGPRVGDDGNGLGRGGIDPPHTQRQSRSSPRSIRLADDIVREQAGEDDDDYDKRGTGQTGGPPSIHKQTRLRATLSGADLVINPHTAVLDDRTLEAGVFSTRSLLQDREAELLMHYLDHVFGRQFRFYHPSVDVGGRGWLLWLLVKTGPLYDAALSLSALHQHSLVGNAAQNSTSHAGASGKLNSNSFDQTYTELNDYHTRTLQHLQHYVQSSSKRNGDANQSTNPSEISRQIEILACGVQLISFELFRGGINDWQPHLNALAALIHDLIEKSSKHDEKEWFPRLTPLEYNALLFLISVVTWMDINACASTRTAPRLYGFHSRLLVYSSSSDRPLEKDTHEQNDTNRGTQNIPSMHANQARASSSILDLQRTMGCQNWVMHAIGQIAALNAWRRQTRQTHTLDFRELVERGNEIGRGLQDGIVALLSQRRKEGQSRIQDTSSRGSSQRPITTSHDLTLRVTHIFALSAQIYLLTTISGPYPSISEIQSSVSDTLDSLHEQALDDPSEIRSLVWSLCIAGCMADSPQERERVEWIARRALQRPAPTASTSREVQQASIAGTNEAEQARANMGDAARFPRRDEKEAMEEGEEKDDEREEENSDFGNVGTVLNVIRKCWELRERNSRADGWDWADAMDELGIRALLV